MMKKQKIKINKCYKSLVFITVISLSFYLSAKNVHAADENADRANECENALISVPSILKPVGASNNTEVIETSTIDIPGVMKGIFSFPIDAERKKQIEVEYRFGDIDDIYFISRVNLKFLKKILDAMPAVLLDKVDKITILFRRAIFRPPLVIFGSTPNKEEGSQLEEAQDKFLANEIALVIPYFPQAHESAAFNTFYSFLIYQMRYQLGHIMAYHRYGDIIPGHEWRDAILRDNKNLSSDADVAEDNENAPSDIDIAKDFASTMELYLKTYAGLDHPDITRKYARRFEILDEIMGLDIYQRAKIIERNLFIERQLYEIR